MLQWIDNKLFLNQSNQSICVTKEKLEYCFGARPGTSRVSLELSLVIG